MGEIRFVGTGERRGYAYLVCKKSLSGMQEIFVKLGSNVKYDPMTCRD